QKTWADATLLLCLSLFFTLSAYDNYTIGALLPSLQKFFRTSDSSVAIIKTCNAVAHGIALGAVWLYGDFIPKRSTFILSMAAWILISFASLIVGSNQFWVSMLIYVS
ncbi:hypothetical protein PFISCL1PPCAC_22226, partial [Pristionchus fissidentatus]